MQYLYRLNGGEVLSASTDAGTYDKRDTALFGVLTDPATPDGPSLKPPKVWDGQAVRNATLEESLAAVDKALEDQKVVERARAKSLLTDNPVWKPAFMSLLNVVVIELNNIRKAAGLPDLVEAKVLEDVLATVDLGTYDGLVTETK